MKTRFEFKDRKAAERYIEYLNGNLEKEKSFHCIVNADIKLKGNRDDKIIQTILITLGFRITGIITDSKVLKSKIRKKYTIYDWYNKSQELNEKFDQIKALILQRYPDSNPRIANEGRAWNNGLRVDFFRNPKKH